MFSLEYSLDEALEFVGKKINKTTDLSYLKEDLVAVVREDVRKRFYSAPPTTTGGFVYGGVYWNALKESTLRSRPDRVSGQILIDSGALRDSMTVDGDANFISEIRGTEFTFGSSLNYAGYVQKERPYLVFHDRLKDELSAAILNRINND